MAVNGDDQKLAVPPCQRRRGGRFAHLGAPETVWMMQKGCGGLGKLAGGVALAGTVQIVGGEQLRFYGHGTSTAKRSWVLQGTIETGK